MPEPVYLRHMPVLVAAISMTCDGLHPSASPSASRAAVAAVMHLHNARNTALGLGLFTLYLRRQHAACDIVLAIAGLFIGLVDGYVLWKEAGNVRKAAHRLASSCLFAAAGFAGWTAARPSRRPWMVFYT
ncbi:hypothetical protein PG994_002289 [Apiospora phragmitis]|uniref:DUF1275 domain-containing protein n=1 Tax=Apiospora phragmitis TaxID=2905665 RepID=A0ABR1WVZ9_9PEZI